MVTNLVLAYFDMTLTWTYNKNKFYDISDCSPRDMLNFDFYKRAWD